MRSRDLTGDDSESSKPMVLTQAVVRQAERGKSHLKSAEAFTGPTSKLTTVLFTQMYGATRWPRRRRCS